MFIENPSPSIRFHLVGALASYGAAVRRTEFLRCLVEVKKQVTEETDLSYRRRKSNSDDPIFSRFAGDGWLHGRERMDEPWAQPIWPRAILTWKPSGMKSAANMVKIYELNGQNMINYCSKHRI